MSKNLFAILAVILFITGCTSPPANEEPAPAIPLPPSSVPAETPQLPEIPPLSAPLPISPPPISTAPIPSPTPADQSEPAALPVEPAEPVLPSPSEVLSLPPGQFNPSAYGNPHPKIPQNNYGTCCNHPYWHKVYRAFSDDGMDWEKENVLIREHASVPDALLKDDGTVIVYYVDGEYDTMDCIVSKDDGRSFNYGNCTMYGFTEKKIWDPEVVKLDNGFYRMYFFTPSDRPEPGGINRIMSAISADGINWLQENGVRVAYRGVLDPAAIKMDDVWRLYVWYSNGLGPEDSVFIVSRSADGLDFEKEAEFSVGGGVPDVQKISSNEYRLYFCGRGVQVARSRDGVNWGDIETVLEVPGRVICDPGIIQGEEGWVMYYKTMEVKD